MSKGNSWFDRLTTNGLSCAIASFPFALSVSQGNSWFDRLTTNGLSCAPVPPLTLSLSQGRPPFALSVSKGRPPFALSVSKGAPQLRSP